MNWTTCPTCGELLEIRSEERLSRFNHLTLTVSASGEVSSAEFGVTEPIWESCTTMQYLCCAWPPQPDGSGEQAI